MTCAACAGRVERALGQLEGVTASVNYATERAIITGLAPEHANKAVSRIEKAGYGARVHDDADDAWSRRATEVRITSLRRRLLVAAILSVPLMDITIVLALVPGWRFPGWEWLCIFLALPIVTWAAWPFHKATLRNLRHGNVSMDTLVSLGITASFGWAVISLLLGIGQDGSGYWLGFGVTPEGANSIYLDVAAGMTDLPTGRTLLRNPFPQKSRRCTRRTQPTRRHPRPHQPRRHRTHPTSHLATSGRRVRRLARRNNSRRRDHQGRERVRRYQHAHRRARP